MLRPALARRRRANSPTVPAIVWVRRKLRFIFLAKYSQNPESRAFKCRTFSPEAQQLSAKSDLRVQRGSEKAHKEWTASTVSMKSFCIRANSMAKE